MRLGCTYLIVRDMKKSIAFYEALLQAKALTGNSNRWVLFDCKNSLALFNPQYDQDLIKDNNDIGNHFNDEYILFKQNEHIRYGNNMVLNFIVDDLRKEYMRIKNLYPGKVTEIMYINVVAPYYFFMLEDPDGNKIEITGRY